MCQAKPSREWISIREAARRIDSHYPALRRLIDMRKLSVRQLPGGLPRVNAGEVDRLAAESTHLAQPACTAA